MSSDISSDSEIQRQSAFTPREIVSELDRFIVGQNKAKKAVAIALRNRWRRQQLSKDMREEVLPKNILMIGSTGVGKTEIARRLAKLDRAPFLKVEATKFTEVGYVGRDVESIIRDLTESAFKIVQEEHRYKHQAKAQANAQERILDALVGSTAGADTRQKFRSLLHAGKMDEKEVEIEVSESASSGFPTMDLPGGQLGMINLNDLMGKAMSSPKVKKKMYVPEAFKILKKEEADKLVDEEMVQREALEITEQNGIVFLDEIDKIATRQEGSSQGTVSREGVQRDLLPLVEGTTVSTKYGSVKTDHILFIASGAFHVSKPSDLLPELQGRLPIRVELDSLSKEDFRRILVEPENSLIKQYTALLGTEKVKLIFTEEAIEEIAALSAQINSSVENIGARRLHTVLEKLLEEISFTATDRSGEEITIEASTVRERVGTLAASADLSRFIL